MKKREEVHYAVGDYLFTDESDALAFEGHLVSSKHYYVSFDTKYSNVPLLIVSRSGLSNAVLTYLIQTFGSPTYKNQSGSMVDAWNIYEKDDIDTLNDIICFWHLYNKKYASETRYRFKIPIVFIDEYGRDITSVILSEVHNANNHSLVSSIDLTDVAEIPMNTLEVHMEIAEQLKKRSNNDFTSCATCSNCYTYDKNLHCLANGGKKVNPNHACLQWTNS